MKDKSLFLKMHIVLERNLGKIPGYETEAGLVKSDLVYNMDHMRISGIEPSSVSLSQRKYLKRLQKWPHKRQSNRCKPTD